MRWRIVDGQLALVANFSESDESYVVKSGCYLRLGHLLTEFDKTEHPLKRAVLRIEIRKCIKIKKETI